MGMIDKQMQPGADAAAEPADEATEESKEDPQEEATESPAAEQAEDAQEPAEPDEGGGTLTITPQSVQAKLHLQPKQVPILQRVVIAGMKIMFDPKSHKLMLDTLKGQGDIVTKLGQGITGLIGLLLKESQGAIPGELLIPSGMVLMAHAADYINKTGTPITDQQFGDAVQLFVHTIMHVSGMDADKAASLGEKSAGAGAPAPDAAPGAPPAEEAPEGPPDAAAGPLPGMINRGMQQ